MENNNTYFSSFFKGIKSLSIGLKTTMREFFTPKVTEQYPENRKELKMFDRFRGTLVMPHNEQNEHHCVACGLCQMACPNGTIRVTSETIETEDGKKKKILAYEYNLGSCMFCQLCVNACPHGAITFDQQFEHAVFDRSKLILTLNHPGSHVEEKKKLTLHHRLLPADGDHHTHGAFGHLSAVRALRYGRHLLPPGIYLPGFRADHGICGRHRRALRLLHPAH